MDKDKAALLLLIIISLIRFAPAGPMLIDPDSYYHYRMTGYLAENGKLPEWDYLSHAPEGRPADYPPLLHLIGYAGFALAKNKLTLMETVSTIGGILGIISILSVYAITRKFYGWQTGFAAAAIFTAMPVQIEWGSAGVFSSYLLGVLTSAATIFAGYLLIEKKKPEHAAMLLGTMLLGKLAWNGWIYPLVVLGAYVLVQYIHKDEQRKKHMLKYAAGGVGLALLGGIVFWSAYAEHAQEITVMQKKVPPFGMAVVKLTPLALLSIVGAAEAARKKSAQNLLILSWAVASIPLVLLGYRYLLYASVPIAMLSALGLMTISKMRPIYAIAYAAIAFPIYANSIIAPIGLIALVGLAQASGRKEHIPRIIIMYLLAATLMAGYVRAAYLEPQRSTDVIDGLHWIKENTKENAIVIAEWDDGHYISAIARRGNIADGYFYSTEKQTNKGIELEIVNKSLEQLRTIRELRAILEKNEIEKYDNDYLSDAYEYEAQRIELEWGLGNGTKTEPSIIAELRKNATEHAKKREENKKQISDIERIADACGKETVPKQAERAYEVGELAEKCNNIAKEINGLEIEINESKNEKDSTETRIADIKKILEAPDSRESQELLLKYNANTIMYKKPIPKRTIGPGFRDAFSNDGVVIFEKQD